MTDRVLVTLPWPERALWPNKRVHWATLAKARRKARRDGYFLSLETGVKLPSPAHLQFTFCPPSRRKFDTDNALSACKGYIDGMADASKCDDTDWTCVPEKGDKVPGGKVEVTLIRYGNEKAP